MNIQKAVKSGAVGLFLLLAFGGAIVGWQVDTVRFGGAMHLESRQMSDLTADILPPPQYVIEPYLEASLLVIDPSTVDTATARLKALRAAYDERHRHWAAAALPDNIKAGILERTDAPAQKFWAIIETRLLPAARSRDRAALTSAYRALQDAYTRHRFAVDALVTDTMKHQQTVETNAIAMEVLMVVILAILATMLASALGLASFWLIRRVIKPMADLSNTTSAMATGKLVAVPHTDRDDELGAIAHALERFATTTKERQDADAAHLAEQDFVNRTLGDYLVALRDGDLTRSIDAEFPYAYFELRRDYNAAIESLKRMVSAVYQSANAIDRGTGEISDASNDLARRTEANAANLEETSAALQQVSIRIRVALDATNDTRNRADDAIQAVILGRKTGEYAAASMDRVSERAKDIGSVIEGLDKIAFQTRVLAMNAAIEAGNAGEAGRGFAVVAGLVSALAVRAEDEAKRVRDLITETRAEVAVAVDAVHRMDGSLATISTDVESVHKLLLHLARDGIEQSRAIGEIASTMQTLDAATQQNAAMVEEASAAVATLSSEVGVLLEHTRRFQFEHAAGTRVERPVVIAA